MGTQHSHALLEGGNVKVDDPQDLGRLGARVHVTVHAGDQRVLGSGEVKVKFKVTVNITVKVTVTVTRSRLHLFNKQCWR